MKSAMEKALDKAKSVNVQKLEEPKPPKGIPASDWDGRPSIYLDDKQLSTISRYKAGDKVVLAVECSVQSINTYDRKNGNKSEKSMSCSLTIEAIADITKG